MTTLELLQKTRAAMGSIAAAGAEKKNALLLAMADSLEARCAEILAANAEDMAAARGRITDVMLDRLKLDENRKSKRDKNPHHVSAGGKPTVHIANFDFFIAKYIRNT